MSVSVKTLSMFFMAVCVTAVPLSHSDLSDEQLQQQFAAFKIDYNRSYPTATEETMRFSTFATNVRAAAALQSESESGNISDDDGATFGVGPLSDLTSEEFSTMLGRIPRNESVIMATAQFASPPKRPASVQSVDWRAKGLVTHVKNQGQCGSCWSFGTTGVIEGAWAKAGNKLKSLSEGEFVDCDKVDAACNGGLQSDALDYAIKNWNGDVEPATAYPYVPHKAPCVRVAKAVGATIKSWKQVRANEDEIADAVAAYGPVTVGVDAGNKWQSYSSGIICSMGHSLDHAVLIVGFDFTGKTPYWIVKNSWGKSWGEAGYVRIAKGKDCFGIKKDVQAAFA